MLRPPALGAGVAGELNQLLAAGAINPVDLQEVASATESGNAGKMGGRTSR
jgi:hypothetical protein